MQKPPDLLVIKLIIDSCQFRIHVYLPLRRTTTTGLFLKKLDSALKFKKSLKIKYKLVKKGKISQIGLLIEVKLQLLV